MTLYLPPSEAISPELSEERLKLLGDVIAKARRDKLAKREPADASWNLSCDCHMWAWHALEEASRGPLADWLHVPGKHGSLDRIMYVGGLDGIPIKFYNADSPGQPLRTSRPTVGERGDPNQSDLFVTLTPQVGVSDDVMELPVRSVIRIAIHMRPDLSAGSASLQRVDPEGNVLYEWPIPLESSGVLPFGQALREPGVELPEPMVELTEEIKAREEAARKKADEHDNSKGA